MEVQDRSRSPSRKTSRVEQVVGRWLRRSRDLGSRSHSLSRDRVADGKAAESSLSDQRNYSFRFTVQIQRDPGLRSHGLTLTTQSPILVQDITPGGPADGRLVSGDQLVKINNVAVDDLTPEQAAEIIRECQESLTMTVLRTMLGPKSSFITPEKRAKLRSNPVKVHFAEEVEVNGHAQGNSLLFLPNVLKVYLENGQTKAFKFEPSTTVKDIVMTLKEKLSLSRIEHFALALEQQPGVTKLLLLHDEERIEQVVQKKEARDYRCLFRVCFMPKNLHSLLDQDPATFMYLYLQGVNDVLQERFAVEMRCNTALRLAALHIQERLANCGQSPKTNLKTLTKTWSIDNFVSSTLLRNMREKELRKAIGYHMKKSQSQHDPKQRGLSVDQARINYLEELSELKSFGGKSFSATMMLQDRESMVTLLVGARYGVSQVVNHKLSILSTLTEFSSITRIELLPESDKVSLVKIYLQDIKPITLLLESVAAKDMSCLIAGYCRLFVDPTLNIFPWIDDAKKHRVSAEEGYVSRCGSDSDSSDLDMEPLVAQVSQDEKPRPRVRSSSDPDGRKRRDKERRRQNTDKEKADTSEDKKERCQLRKTRESEGGDDQKVHVEVSNCDSGGKEVKLGSGEEAPVAEELPPASEASDSCRSDSHVLTSPSSDSLDALEEDDLLSCSSSAPLKLHHHPPTHAQPHLLAPPPPHSHPLIQDAAPDRGASGAQRSGQGAGPQLVTPASPSVTDLAGSLGSSSSSLCFADLSRLADLLPSPPEASEDDEEVLSDLRRRKVRKEPDELAKTSGEGAGGHSVSLSPSPNTDCVFNFDRGDTRCYYNLCSNITPDSPRSLSHPQQDPASEWEGGGRELEPIPILQPPPGFGDSSSDDEFFDARDGFTSPEDPTSGAKSRDTGTEGKLDFSSLGADKDGSADYSQGISEEGGARETVYKLRRRSRKRRSFVDSEYTSRVSFPQPDPERPPGDDAHVLSLDPEPSEQTENPSPTVSSLTHSEGEPSQLESKPILSKASLRGQAPPPGLGIHGQSREPQLTCQTRKREMEMEPDSMESKSVTATVKVAPPTITVVRCRVDPDGKECSDRRGDGKEEAGGLENSRKDSVEGEKRESSCEPGLFPSHMFLPNVSVEEEKKEVEKLAIIRTFIGAEPEPEALTSTDTDKEGRNGLLGAQLVTLEQNEQEEAAATAEQSAPLSPPPPPPPPSSPVPPGVRKEGVEQMCLPNSTELSVWRARKAQFHLEVTTIAGEDGTINVPSPTLTNSDEITDSNNSDNVFEDEEAGNSLNANSGESRGDRSGTGTSSATAGTDEPLPAPHTEPQTRMNQFTRDYDRAIHSITAKLGAATNATSPTFYSGTKLKSEPTTESVSHENLERLRSVGSLTALVAAPSLTKVAEDVDPPPPTRFLFQTCSPSFMGRLSASTLRGKIQQLPLYLSKSQESLNQAGAGRSPAEHQDTGENVGITITDVDDVTKTIDLELDTSAESVDSDDSDTTLTGSEVDGECFMDTTSSNSPLPVQMEPKSQHVYTGPSRNTPGPITQPPASIVNSFYRDNSGPKLDTPGPVKTFPSSPVVVTTQNMNGPGLPFHRQAQTVKRTSSDRPLAGLCSLGGQTSDASKPSSPDCRVFTICEDSSQAPAVLDPSPPLEPEPGCNSLLASGCESMVERVQVPLDACGCPAVYTNCFGSTESFDEELTVFEFSCRSQNSVTQACGAVPLMASSPIPSLISTSSSISPFFPPSGLFSSSACELSPLLSPLSDASAPPLSGPQRDALGRLGQQCYPEPPAGFQVLRLDVDQLLSILETNSTERCVAARHPREFCPAHFTENKRVLQVEARRLMSGCQKVVGGEQSPGEMLHSLAESFRTLVDLAGTCLLFSGCDRCDRRNTEAVAGLADVARSFRDFCLAAERVSSRRSCQDLSMKLLAKQCTALTASVFCLTQLFRTLTAL
ncbi:FERM and PDZ domain-containing protein 1 [Takifugu rubripes]|uniref:FERM and PDZ domain-containing protein 1 n=1 Tax=Takifugu rubripes TaxID=31033 RepID=UPI00114554AF|nr:FERM and PDZ domain-containing protein 1-like [Takifugu rubripes]